MKKRISIILVITILLSMLNCVTTSASVLYHMDEIGEKIVVQKANFQTTFSFDWDGKQIKQYYTNTVDDEIDYLMDLFSDKNLVNTGEVFDEYMLYDEERPNVGVFDFSLDGGGNCLVFFDENEVMYIERGYEPDETEKFRMYAKQGMFKYRNEDVYPEIQAFMEEVVNEQKRLEEEKRLEREEAIKKQEEESEKWYEENGTPITNFNVIYKASFPTEGVFIHDQMWDPCQWGICTYNREGESELLTFPFFVFGDAEGTMIYMVSGTSPKNNVLHFENERGINIVGNSTTGVEYPLGDGMNSRFQINVTDDLKTESVIYTAYKDGKDYSTQEIDMSTYTEYGTLPKEYFSPDYNIKEVEKEEEKEEEKEPEKVETFDVKQYVHDTVMEENISEELKDEQTYSVSWRAYSEDIVYSSNLNDWRAENKKLLIINRVSQIYDFIEKNGTQIDRSAYMKRFREIFPFNNELSDNPAKTYACIKIVGTGVKVFTLTVYDEYVEIEMKNQHTGECQYEYHKVSDANALLEYISDISFMGFAPAKEEIVIDNIDIKNKTINSKPLKVVETYSFKVDVDQNSYKSIYKELAELGEKIECTLTHVMPESGNDSKSYFILEMKGSKATRSFYTAYGSALHYGKCELYFNKNRVYENNQLKNVKSNKPSWTLEFYGTAKNGEVNAVVLSYEFTNPLSTVNRNSSKEFYGNTVCQDFEYEFLLDEYEWNKNKNIPYMITFDEDEEWMDKKEAYNKRKALGITYDMFRVNALAHVRLDIDDAVAPDWYKELGKNVNLMILSVSSETRFGRTTAPMLRLRGAGGEIWFDYSGINHIDFPNEELHFSWKANVGFDPTRSDEDHTVEGKLSGKILCSGGMDSVVESIELYIGGETYKFGINEFNVIGCDVLTRDLMYRRTADYQKAYWDELDDFMSNMKYGYVYRY